jgi:hypothetical protein
VASFEREAALVEHLVRRLKLDGASISNPNADGVETGMDVLVRLPDGRAVGVQITELDPHTQPGRARAEEKKNAGTGVYGGWAQNNPSVALDSLVRTIERKIEIARRHSFESVREVWLLVCGGIPEHGAVISTFVMTPCLSETDIDRVTGGPLQGSKYDRCFFFPIIGAEQAFYTWEKNGSWKKSVKLDEVWQASRAAYANGLLQAAADGNWGEVDRLCDDECRIVLSELRQS